MKKICTNPDCATVWDRDDVAICLKCGWTCVPYEAKKKADKAKDG